MIGYEQGFHAISFIKSKATNGRNKICDRNVKTIKLTMFNKQHQSSPQICRKVQTVRCLAGQHVPAGLVAAPSHSPERPLQRSLLSRPRQWWWSTAVLTRRLSLALCPPCRISLRPLLSAAQSSSVTSCKHNTACIVSEATEITADNCKCSLLSTKPYLGRLQAPY